MLPHIDGETPAERYQWVQYQLKILENLLSQYARAIDKGNSKKITEVLDLAYQYGKIQYERSEFEFDTEYLLTQKEIFDKIREV